ncbi:hypothetical protein ACEK06_29325 [Pseudomonas brenneri]|uniref:hypothetical protein n=1 Tax=Pseudomonas brenneri TaxID=129817 RepID=UPI0035709F71
MEITEFTQGVTYQMKIVPYLDCDPGEEVFKVLTVLEPANQQNSLWDDGVSCEAPPAQVLAEWKKFLRVKDEKGNVRLQWPSLIVEAVAVT